MIWLWVVLALMTGGVLAGLLRPLLRVNAAAVARADFDIAVYRDQLDELRRDEERGTLSASEAAAAWLEIERRLLAATAKAEAPPPAPRPARFAAILVMLTLPIAAVGLYLALGEPDMPDQPLASRSAERALLAEDGTLDPAKVKVALEARLKADPESLDGWLLLARTDASLGAWDDGKAAYEKAMAMSKDRPDVMEGYAELLVGSAQGQVTDPAMDLFTRAVAADHNRIKARYYLALSAAQHGDLPQAIAGWKALEADAPAGAPWRATVTEMREEAERRLAGGAPDASPSPSTDPGGPRDSAAAQIAKLPPGEQGQAIRGMVEGLAARLEAHPDDLAGWQRLARAYVVLGEGQKAEAAYRQVLQRDPKQPDALWQLGLAAAATGRTQEAADHWKTLLDQLPPGSPEAGRVQKAIEQLQAAK
ncbi:cytochrome c-type biogenesis protein CycH [Aliidongia dinghuensis]|uniref:Cytochrome c-type biogenesis protein CycH n=1 Tax=Aliidongia dinghuensis TaxID=1867774 RepID=A0A8J3E6X9_9PROT|nr:c-type cytochrome biogenesis protein CcmI [Aliidongia dinghuensis]GGF33424.1 cytochrome c-type biogenesis protein CycH [Aliidongia dinghuensis]